MPVIVRELERYMMDTFGLNRNKSRIIVIASLPTF